MSKIRIEGISLVLSNNESSFKLELDDLDINHCVHEDNTMSIYLYNSSLFIYDSFAIKSLNSIANFLEFYTDRVNVDKPCYFGYINNEKKEFPTNDLKNSNFKIEKISFEPMEICETSIDKYIKTISGNIIDIKGYDKTNRSINPYIFRTIIDLSGNESSETSFVVNFLSMIAIFPRSVLDSQNNIVSFYLNADEENIIQLDWGKRFSGTRRISYYHLLEWCFSNEGEFNTTRLDVMRKCLSMLSSDQLTSELDDDVINRVIKKANETLTSITNSKVDNYFSNIYRIQTEQDIIIERKFKIQGEISSNIIKLLISLIVGLYGILLKSTDFTDIMELFEAPNDTVGFLMAVLCFSVFILIIMLVIWCYVKKTDNLNLELFPN